MGLLLKSSEVHAVVSSAAELSSPLVSPGASCQLLCPESGCGPDVYGARGPWGRGYLCATPCLGSRAGRSLCASPVPVQTWADLTEVVWSWGSGAAPLLTSAAPFALEPQLPRVARGDDNVSPREAP